MSMINKTVKLIMRAVRQVAVFALFFVFFPFFSSHVSAHENIDLLIVNSDYSVKKYALAQDVFEANQEKPSISINLPDLSSDEASDLIKKNQFKIIYCIGTKAYLLVQRLVPEQNIVFSSAINWRRLPVTEKSYGIAQELPAGMQLMMYRYLFPEIKKIGVLYSKQFNNELLQEAIQSAEDMGIDVIGQDVSDGQNLSTAIKKLLPEVDALWLISDPHVLADRAAVSVIFQQTKISKKPVFTYSKVFIDFGALLVISADTPTIGRQVSARVDDLLGGRVDMERVSIPAGSHVVLNMKQLKNYSLKLNKEALGSVNQIIE
ncbi:MAG: hypothetical protein GQ532_18155 [Methylomarinum sp.]|nr:hypothetical protein [Methylomarinum sp.]